MTKSSTPTILITGATGNIVRKFAESFDDFARDYAPTFVSRLGTLPVRSSRWKATSLKRREGLVNATVLRELTIRINR